jgi:hypothetical protein
MTCGSSFRLSPFFFLNVAPYVSKSPKFFVHRKKDRKELIKQNLLINYLNMPYAYTVYYNLLFNLLHKKTISILCLGNWDNKFWIWRYYLFSNYNSYINITLSVISDLPVKLNARSDKIINLIKFFTLNIYIKYIKYLNLRNLIKLKEGERVNFFLNIC